MRTNRIGPHSPSRTLMRVARASGSTVDPGRQSNGGALLLPELWFDTDSCHNLPAGVPTLSDAIALLADRVQYKVTEGT